MLEYIITDEQSKNKRIHPDEQAFLLYFTSGVIYRCFKSFKRRTEASNHKYISAYQEFSKSIICVDEATDFHLIDLLAMRSLEDYEETFKDPKNAVTVLFDENPVLSTVICKEYYSNSIASILIRIYNLSKTGSNNTIRPMLSLEHVLPQKHTTNWSEASEFAGRSIYQLGNMIMLKKELNSSASNLDYAAKKNLYTEQNVEDYLGTLSVLSIENQTDWNENLILQRSASVSNQVMKILKSMDYVTFSTYGNSSNEVDQS